MLTHCVILYTKGSADLMSKNARDDRKNTVPPCVNNVEDAFLYNPVASATDCTGYVQQIPEYENEAESYAELYDVPVASYDGGEAAPPAK